MNRPYTFCHILSALDGKITGPFMSFITVVRQIHSQSLSSASCLARCLAELCSRLLTVWRAASRVAFCW